MKSVRPILEMHLQENREALASHNALASKLTHLEGMSLTDKRIKKALGEDWSLDNRVASLQYAKQKDGHTHFLGWSNIFTMEQFKRADTANSDGSVDRIIQLEKILNDKELLKAVDAYYSGIAKAYGKIKAMVENEPGGCGSYENPAHYSIFKTMGIDNGILSDIQYGKR